mgnify:FL=1
MSVVEELLRAEQDGTISFGDYSRASKSKLDDFEFNGDILKVKTYGELTKLERNGLLVYESVPGTSVLGLDASDKGLSFELEGAEDAQVTLQLEEDTEYELSIDGRAATAVKTNMGGKLSFFVELDEGRQVKVVIKKL